MANVKRIIIFVVIGIILIVCAVGAIYLTFFNIQQCSNYECWQKYMKICSKISFINEETEASWGYVIKEIKNKQCVIEVTMLQAKKGELGIEKLMGEKMTCYYPEGIVAYAQRDLSKCHGLLKEELQVIIINKLHAYILENLGKFEESINSI